MVTRSKYLHNLGIRKERRQNPEPRAKDARWIRTRTSILSLAEREEDGAGPLRTPLQAGRGLLKKNERGVALLAVLLGIALMTLVVVDFAMTSGLGFVEAANQANELRASYLARSAINIGLGLLAADARSDAQGSSPIDTLTDVWAVPFPPMSLEGGTVSLSIVDEARKLNINSMMGQNG